MTDLSQEPADGSGSGFYVGYLSVPQGLRRFLRAAATGGIALIAIIALALARSQADPGTGVWEDSARTIRGTVAALPYPMIYADDRGDGKAGFVLLVEPGKHGGGQRAATMDGRRAAISGTLLRRDGRYMLEMDPGQEAIRPDGDAIAVPKLPTATSLGTATLRGEIVDSKCYLGAMKPGEGKTHKECATLCVMGGIPPMIVSHDAHGTVMYVLLVDSSGEPFKPEGWPFVGDRVEVTGKFEEQGGLLRLRVRVSDVHRL